MDNNLAKNIKYLRIKNKLTQIELGKKLGVKGNTITGYENGSRCPDFQMCAKISLLFGIDLNSLIQTNLQLDGEKEYLRKNIISKLSDLNEQQLKKVYEIIDIIK